MGKGLGFVLLASFSMACQTRVLRGLEEREANEAQSALLDQGLEASKVLEPGKRPTWAIDVPAAKAAEATRALSMLGLPRPKSKGFLDVFGKGSLVPTPLEERALFVEALSGEIAQTLGEVEGVVAARVHLVPAQAERPGQVPIRARASALLRVRAKDASRLAKNQDAIRRLVAGSVDGLSPEEVTLLIDEVGAARPQEMPAARASSESAAAALWCSLVALLAAALTLLVMRHRRELRKASELPVRPAMDDEVGSKVLAA